MIIEKYEKMICQRGPRTKQIIKHPMEVIWLYVLPFRISNTYTKLQWTSVEWLCFPVIIASGRGRTAARSTRVNGNSKV